MFARVTQLEIDTLRQGVDEALAQFRRETLPRLQAQPGYRGVFVLTTPAGHALLLSLWETDAEASTAPAGFYGEELARFATVFKAPPGRESYEVSIVDEPTQAG